jgi:membrane-bound ClpP family serine protease
MIWFIIISLIIIGLILLIVEVVFIPGTTIVGILGGAFAVIGVVITYQNIGSTAGFYVLLVTLVATALALYFSFRSGAWNAFSLKSAIQSKVNEGATSHLKVGDEGETISALRPFGKAEFGNLVVEVRSLGTYTEPKSRVKIIQIDSSQIIVDIIT